ncbi:MAG: outer membrane beta-barrel protein [Flavobacterium sp.]|nr:outer membrane beta-barrel protein [Flavobacterium sp.]
MKLTFRFLVFLLCFFSSFAQTKITLKGKLIDKETSTPIEDATVYITTVKDSTMINYTVSDKNGIFKFETKKIGVPFFLSISATGYQNHKIKENSGTENKDFGVFSILKNHIELSEVVVKAEAPPVKIKKDTLEFNAASFKVRPDANVEALIRQLPGVQIDENKTITINGKVVDKILVNGKPFFSEDGKIAIQNLSADMVKKVQVSNTKSKEEEMTKQDSSSNTSTINLTLKEDKNKGVFGKFMGGYGTDDRYESSGIASYFKNKRRVTAIVSSNNINATGFSMDDVFDNMGGGRNNGGMRVMMGGPGNNSAPTGITRSATAGLNYDDEWIKDLSAHTSYNYKNLDNENRNKSSKAEFLPTGNIFTESESASNQLTEGHNLSTEFQYKINDNTNIYLNPSFAKTTTTSNSAYQASSRDDNNDLMNENSGKTNSYSDSGNFNNFMGFFRSFKKKGRYFNASMQNNNSRNEYNSISNSATLFYQNATPDDIRNQNVLSERSNDNLSFNLSYSEPITDSLSVSVGVRTNWSKSKDYRNTFDFDTATGRYSDKNELRSNYFETKSSRFSPTAGLVIRKKKLNLWAMLGTYFVEADNFSDYLNSKTNLSKNYALPEGNLNFSYNFSKTKNLRAYYYRQYSLPLAQQILPVANLSNPLNTYIGNSNLDIGKSHYANFNYGNQNTASLSGFSIYLNVNYSDSSIASTSVYDENGKQKTTYVNISGNYNLNLGANWDKTIKKEQNTFKYSLRLNTGYDFQKGFTNAEMYTAQIKSVSPGVSFSYDYGYFFTLRPSYNFTFRKTDYTNYRIDEVSNREHNFKIEATNYIHKQWVFGNDFGYNYNSNISGGFKKDFYLWNASLSYKTKEDQWIFKVKAYDILDQNQSATRSISATSVTDSQNMVLKRYGMFSITYKFKKFGMKLEEEKPNEKAPEKAPEKTPVKVNEKK